MCTKLPYKCTLWSNNVNTHQFIAFWYYNYIILQGSFRQGWLEINAEVQEHLLKNQIRFTSKLVGF